MPDGASRPHAEYCCSSPSPRLCWRRGASLTAPLPLDWRRTMSELDARYARGQDTRRMFGGGTITSAGSVPGAWDIAPDLERILGEALFGTIWRRDALSPVQREMITLSTLIVL